MIVVLCHVRRQTFGNAIAPGQTVELRSPLPAGATEVSVRYTGTKTLVLLETRFE